MSVLDAMSQTATFPSGFSADEVVAAYYRGDFDGSITCAPDTAQGGVRAVNAFKKVLSTHLGASFPHVSFANSGAEANEKALALCRNENPSPSASKVLAFQGSFHGRTLLALHATWNPSKRGPFEIEGHEASFAPFPGSHSPWDEEPREPEGFVELMAAADLVTLANQTSEWGDALWRAELESFEAVHNALSGGNCFACIVEPMQSEGGDNYASARFYRGLRLLTRHHGVPLIMDEVQCGFGLSGPFLWHSRFNLVDADGNPDAPDAVTFAKRAQVGVCASRFNDPEPTSAHPASLVRGRVHAELVDPEDAERVQAYVKPRLQELAGRFPELVGRPRNLGYALAFDLPTPQHLNNFLGQRFWRGAVVFGAGSKTVRYRLNKTFEERELNLLFEAIRRSLSWLDAHPHQSPPAWEDLGRPQENPQEGPEVRVREVGAEDADDIVDAIMALEREVFEPARRDTEETLRLGFSKDGIALVGDVRVNGSWKLAGYALAAPLEAVSGLDGVDDDPNRGQNNTLYSIAISVSPNHQGLGLGSALKAEQFRIAKARQTVEGHPRYRYLTGRNRVGEAGTMTLVNRKFGAYIDRIYSDQYGEEGAKAAYYRMVLGAPSPLRHSKSKATSPLRISDGIAAPFGSGPVSLREAEAQGVLYGPVVNKITVLNYITPAIARGIEWVQSLVPSLPHIYLTSSRDETVDKALRVLRTSRTKGQVAIGLEGGYVGHTSAAARSLSDPLTHRQGSRFFQWPLVAHPSQAGTEQALVTLRHAINDAGGPESVLGIFVEPVQERTGMVLSADYLAGLDVLRRETGIPIVAVETASACYRSGRGPFASVGAGFLPDLLIWWGGGQVGFVHVNDTYWVGAPLAMASTWDGDELSLIRVHHHLRAALQIDISEATDAFVSELAPALSSGLEIRGLGLYQILSGPGTESLAAGLLK
ncbi:MAG: aminotransferase class III-fold pyridoxal phosphate-dependent enzyme, partial [Myxococcales bacterium]|nr:aminotransferase class III-fold pyridoxal phosphate-dependent enzyme [Myxococcales bacterium]